MTKTRKNKIANLFYPRTSITPPVKASIFNKQTSPIIKTFTSDLTQGKKTKTKTLLINTLTRRLQQFCNSSTTRYITICNTARKIKGLSLVSVSKKPSLKLQDIRSDLQQATGQRRAQESYGIASVEGVVRALIGEIEDAKTALMTWNEIAEILANRGVCWKNGKPITGASLRVIMHRLRIQRASTANQPSHKGPERLILPSSPLSSLSSEKKAIQSAEISPGKNSTDKIREEMRRSIRERTTLS